MSRTACVGITLPRSSIRRTTYRSSTPSGAIRQRSPLPELSFPGGLRSQDQSLEQPVTVHVTLRFRSRRAGALGSDLPTPSTTKPLFVQHTGSTLDRRSTLAGAVVWRRTDSIKISP